MGVFDYSFGRYGLIAIRISSICFPVQPHPVTSELGSLVALRIVQATNLCTSGERVSMVISAHTRISHFGFDCHKIPLAILSSASLSSIISGFNLIRSSDTELIYLPLKSDRHETLPFWTVNIYKKIRNIEQTYCTGFWENTSNFYFWY